MIDTLSKQNPMYTESELSGSTPGDPFDESGIQDTHRQKSSQDKKILFLVAACNDNFIRFFNLQSIKMPLAYESRDHNGQPLAFDISPDK
jgi:hypothetical protein